MAQIVFDNFTFTYPGQEKPALKNVSLTVESGSFTCLIGASGSGKTTLLRHLIPALAPVGTTEGTMRIYGKAGLVQQDPDSQIVTDTVWHELAFALENEGRSTEEIRSKVAEMATFFGLEPLFEKEIMHLSGGQKQLLNLAAVLVTEPDILLLDEPLAQLDPVAAHDLIQLLVKINEELGTTILLSEHRLEEVFPVAEQVLLLENGGLALEKAPGEMSRNLWERAHPLRAALPDGAKIYGLLADGESVSKAMVGDCPSSWPVTVKEGRRFLKSLLTDGAVGAAPDKQAEMGACDMTDKKQIHVPTGEISAKNEPPSILCKDLWYRYEKDEQDILKGVDLSVNKGEILAIVGGNGAGKTTVLRALAGVVKAHRGTCQRVGKVALVPQDPTLLFSRETVREELKGAVPEDLMHLADRHPYDLSGGEQQRLAMTMAMAEDPDILLLDEPTKGVDAAYKEVLGEQLAQMAKAGKTVILVSHDTGFCAAFSDRCGLLFDGVITALEETRVFFSHNRFYTTAAARIARSWIDLAVTPKQVAEGFLLRMTGGEPPTGGNAGENHGDENGNENHGGSHLDDFEGDGGNDAGTQGPADGGDSTTVDSMKADSADSTIKEENPQDMPKGPLGTVLITALSIALMGALAFLGIHSDSPRVYYPISVGILLLALVPFYFDFERRKPKARELAVLAVFVALGVVGRAAFILLPQVKPVIAVALLAGAALGCGSGFLAGSMIAFFSNFLFGQGPWTPWQMLALGLVGLLGGLLFGRQKNQKYAPPKKSALIITGIFGAYLYGVIVDGWALLAVSPHPTWAQVMAVYGAGFVFNTVLAVATTLFLLVLADPITRKIVRMRNKYGLMNQWADLAAGQAGGK